MVIVVGMVGMCLCSINFNVMLINIVRKICLLWKLLAAVMIRAVSLIIVSKK